MITLCKSDYQDVYRVKNGVLLIVNKFEYMKNKDGYIGRVYVTNKNSVIYTNGCKDLRRATDRIGDYVEIGQILYAGYPVKLTTKDNWDYQIKTTGDMFSGNLEEMVNYINDIIKIIKRGN